MSACSTLWISVYTRIASCMKPHYPICPFTQDECWIKSDLELIMFCVVFLFRVVSHYLNNLSKQRFLIVLITFSDFLMLIPRGDRRVRPWVVSFAVIVGFTLTLLVRFCSAQQGAASGSWLVPHAPQTEVDSNCSAAEVGSSGNKSFKNSRDSPQTSGWVPEVGELHSFSIEFTVIEYAFTDESCQGKILIWICDINRCI